jgi:hypothetical protein
VQSYFGRLLLQILKIALINFRLEKCLIFAYKSFLNIYYIITIAVIDLIKVANQIPRERLIFYTTKYYIMLVLNFLMFVVSTADLYQALQTIIDGWSDLKSFIFQIDDEKPPICLEKEDPQKSLPGEKQPKHSLWLEGIVLGVGFIAIYFLAHI